KRQHCSKTELGGTPGECVHSYNSAHAFGQVGDAGETGQSTQIVNDQHEVLELQLSDDGVNGLRRTPEVNLVCGQALTQAGSWRVQTHTAETGRQRRHDVAPDDRAQAGVHEQQYWSATQAGNRYLRAVDPKRTGRKWPDRLR